MEHRVTPDGIRYVAASQQRVPRPFHYRWLLPKICRDRYSRWRIATWGALYACLPLLYVYCGGGWRGMAAALCLPGLSGVWHFNRKFPVLVDATAMAFALAAAVATQHGYWTLGLALAIVGGCARETSPLFAALYAWNPLMLIGMIAPALRHLQREGPDVLDEENAWILRHPILASRKYHQGMNAQHLVLPWGATLVALSNTSYQLALTAGVAYAQCLVATDTVRLYMWAFPVVLASAVHAVPLMWLPLIVALTIANPFATEGA